MFFIILSLTVTLAQAGFLFEKFPSSAIQTHIHSPSAISHQSITHKHHGGTPEGRVLTSSSYTTSAIATKQEPVLFSSAGAANNLIKTDTFLVDYSSSSMPVVTYKKEIPVISSAVHTPVDRAYAARPIVYKMLPMIKPAPYISFDAFKLSPSSIKFQN